jgi:Tol biopolymer transport system component/predicted Ser/Thr protein kinase
MLTPGARLGAYEIVGKLGAGGMGEVWRARDTRLDREVALKVLPPGLAEDPERRARLEREAKILASLNHPNIATLYGLEHAGGQDVLVMELVEGEDLAQRLARGALPVAEAIPIGRQIAEALEAAHEKGIVHRDLKPANVKLRPDGAVKVLDFGLARAWESEAPATDLAHSPTVTGQYTRAGQVLGTAAYMSPEQARGGAVDDRADIWAFGAVLFELLAGRRPFDGPSLPDVFTAVLSAEPPWEALPAALPAPMRVLLERCLTRDLRRRLQSIGEARIVLEEAAATPAPRALPAREVTTTLARREVVAWGLAAAALIALGATLTLRGASRGEPAAASTSRRFVIPPPAYGGFEGGIALSPDASLLAFVAPGSDGEDVLWLRPLSDLAPRALAGTGGASYPFFAPDGTRLAFFAKGKLKTYDLAGGRIQVLCAAANPRGGAWSQDGTLLLSIDVGGALVRIPAAGGDPIAVVAPEGDLDAGSFRFPAFLPDGRRFLCLRFGGAAKMGLCVGSLDSREVTLLVEADSGAVFVPPDRLIYRSRERLVAQPFDPATARLTGAATTLADDVWSDAFATILTAFAAAGDRALAYRAGGPARSRLVWYDRAGAQLGTIGPVAPYLEPAISPDGRRVAVTRGANDASGSEIWVFDAEREGGTRFSFGPGFSATPLWSPDGAFLMWSSFATGDVIRKATSGASREDVLWRNPAFWPLSDFTRDGRQVLIEELDFRHFTFDIGRIALAGDHRIEPLLAEAYSELSPRLSADGRFLAYVSNESGVDEVFVRSYPALTERWQVSTAGGTQPRWRGDGRELYFVAPDRKIMAVDVTTAPAFAVSRPRALFQTQILPVIEARNHYDPAPDGRRFLVNSRLSEDATAPIVVVLDWTAELGSR